MTDSKDATSNNKKIRDESSSDQRINEAFLGQKFHESELIIGLVGAVGTELKIVIEILKDRLSIFGYQTEVIRISQEIIPQLIDIGEKFDDEYSRINAFMNAGNEVRRQSGDNSILALGVSAKISANRPVENQNNIPKHRPKNAYIINSLKHPEEVTRLREIYPEGFYLLGVDAEKSRRDEYLKREKRLDLNQVNRIIERDEDEKLEYGQRTSDTFHMSDFFVRLDENQDRLKESTWRILDILFGHPFITPTFDEYAMFMAFSASLRSADLSRQVGAVITKDQEIIATGANDCPKYGGGLYWPEYNNSNIQINDVENGRDHTRGLDSNKVEQQKIIEDIIQNVDNLTDEEEIQKIREALGKSRISDITEYGRVVHAEMEALLSCARNSLSSRGATLYCTTFPCHNCAKHIVAAGIKRVVYVEPYPKSKAAEFHKDAISLGFSEEENRVHFEPFVGVGPRRFFDLFSMRLGSGFPLKRKSLTGKIVNWAEENARLRIQMLPCSYIELELLASSMFRDLMQDINQGENNDER